MLRTPKIQNKMKEQFIQKRFEIGSIRLIEQINGILADYESQGYDLSLRQLYYQLVSKNVVENTERSYKNIGNLVSDARLAGLIDWDIIQDRGRVVVRNSHWTTPAEIVETCVRSYRVDRWLNQEHYVEVMVEIRRWRACSFRSAGNSMCRLPRIKVTPAHPLYMRRASALPTSSRRTNR